MLYSRKYKDFFIRRLFELIMVVYRPERKELKDALAYCSDNIDGYRGRGDRLENYPIMEKRELMADPDRFMNKRFKFKHTGMTSGTTGTPGKFFRDIVAMAAEQYYQAKYFKWKGKYRVIIRGEQLFNIDYTADRIYKAIPFLREMYVSSFHLNDRTMKDLVEKLRKMKGLCLWAYPASAYALADYCRRNRITLKFDLVALSSEMLLDYQREVMEEVFRCPVKDWYGQAERVAALTRCEAGHYHEPENYSHVEYLPVDDGMFEIVGTTLHNRIMPLVRYNMHDLVEISSEPCSCGHLGKNITRISGRSTSYIDLPNGKLGETSLAFLFRGMKNIVEAQIVQKKDRSILLRIVRADGYDAESERTLMTHIARFIPAGQFAFDYPEHIERDARGKFRYVVNELADGCADRKEMG